VTTARHASTGDLDHSAGSTVDELRAAILDGHTALGIELGSTRIKAFLIGPDHQPIAAGGHAWENELADGTWTYSLDAVEAGLRACYADLVADVRGRYGVRPATFGAMGVSAMMHGYLALDEDGELLVPFRTWRNTSTGRAAAELTDALGFNVPLRWSVAHLYQAALDGEPHVEHVRSLTTLAGYVHRRLTGRDVLGVGDASGMFPVDPLTGDYDAVRLATSDRLLAAHGATVPLRDLLPQVLVAGEDAGRLTADGAEFLDPAGTLRAGVPLCPPEGDAGTGMVATHAVAPRTGNVSVGTSVFAMVVLEKALRGVHHEIDVVATPAGNAVAMVHCNNGASELGAWAGVFGRFAEALGRDTDADAVFALLLREALAGAPDAGGILAYNHLSGEPIAGLEQGRPLVVRTPGSDLTLANLSRALVYGVFGTLSLGMQVLAAEGVALDVLHAHGGLFRTEGVAQQLLAAAVRTPVSVGRSAAEGGPWGIALLAAFLHAESGQSLEQFLASEVFARAEADVVEPDPQDARGYVAFLESYTAGLAVERVAADVL
jgi:sugar (pentulose or hexulose) kinase